MELPSKYPVLANHATALRLTRKSRRRSKNNRFQTLLPRNPFFSAVADLHTSILRKWRRIIPARGVTLGYPRRTLCGPPLSADPFIYAVHDFRQLLLKTPTSPSSLDLIFPNVITRGSEAAFRSLVWYSMVMWPWCWWVWKIWERRVSMGAWRGSVGVGV